MALQEIANTVGAAAELGLKEKFRGGLLAELSVIGRI